MLRYIERLERKAHITPNTYLIKFKIKWASETNQLDLNGQGCSFAERREDTLEKNGGSAPSRSHST